MELSRAAIVAIHGIAYLANHDGAKPLDVNEIAEALDIAPPYLAKIFQQLCRSNLVYSRRGPHGGYTLASDPKDISVMEIVEAIDGPVTTDKCELDPKGKCQWFKKCRIRKELDTAKVKTKGIYRHITLDKFAGQFVA